MTLFGKIGRPTLGAWLNNFGLTTNGVEVGCAAGEFARKVLADWAGRRYYMVDPWAVIDGYLERQETMNYAGWYAECVKLSESDKRVVLMRMKSLEAAGAFTSESLDWVYLDAAHDLKNVQDDLEAWYPKVRPGGLFGGHDFMTRMEGDSRIQVDQAVEEFAYRMGLVFVVTPCTSWWIIKP